VRRRAAGPIRKRRAAAILTVAALLGAGAARATTSSATPAPRPTTAPLATAPADDPATAWTGGAPTSIPDSAYPIPSGALFVAPSGNDSGAGTQDDPFATVAHAVAVVPAGGTIVLRAGVYREALGSVAKPITLQSYPHEQAWLSGSNVVTGWSASGSVWVHNGWTTQFCQTCFDPTAITTNFPAAGLPDMVFIDGRPLNQVTSLAAVGPGSFFVDYTAQALYVGDDPTRADTIVEAATQSAALQFNPAAAGSVVRGIGFEEYAPQWNSWPNPAMVLVNAASNVTFDRDAFTRSASRGLTTYASSTTVTNSAFIDNGMVGLHANLADHLDVEHNLVVGNNNEHFASGNGATVSTAGIKITTSQFVIVRDNVVENNFANGIWLDLSDYQNQIVDNLARDNDQNGIDVEVSGSTLVASNLVTGNGVSGLRLTGATDTRAYNNTLAGNATYQLSVHNDGRVNTDPTQIALGITWIAARNVLYGNILAPAPSGSSGPLLFTQDNHRPPNDDASTMISGLDGNVYARAIATTPATLAQWVHAAPAKAATFTTLAQLKTATGYETSGIELVGPGAPPLFQDAATDDYTLDPASPAAGSGLPIPADVAAAVGAATGPPIDRGMLVVPSTATRSSTTTVISPAVVLPSSPTVTVQVAAGDGGWLVPTGLVTLTDQVSGDSLGAATLDATGTAVFDNAALAVGSHTVVATYAGDAYYDGSTNSSELDIAAAATTTTVGTDTAQAVFGQTVTLNALVSGAIAPTGVVTFGDGGDVLGSDQVDGAGNASITVATLAVGSHAISARYGGDGATAPSTDTNDAAVVVSQAASSLALTASPPVPQTGKSVTLTAHAAAVSPGSGVPTGSVTFSDGGTTIGTDALDASGVATVVLPSASSGAHNVTATYSGDTDFIGSGSNGLTLTVVDEPSATSLSASTANSVHGQTVTFTAQVTDAGGAVTDGSVTFSDATNGAVLGASGVDGNGNASVDTAALDVGDHTITADYSGDATDASSSAPSLDFTVARATAAVGATVTPTTPAAGTHVHLHITVSVAEPGSGTPTGTVHVSDAVSGVLLTDATLDGSGAADVDLDAGPAGSRALTIAYAGDTGVAPGSAPVNFAVGQVASTTVASADPATPAYGGLVNLSASVVGGSITATGTVQFRDGTTVLGSAGLDANGRATLAVSTLSAGSHAIVAAYGGDANDVASDSSTAPVVVTVAQAISTTTLGADVTTAAHGQLVTFTAHVSGVAPRGTVTLFDGANQLGAAQSLGASGTVVVKSTALAVGVHELVASYGGDVTNAPSDSSSAPLTVEVDTAATTTALVATPTAPAAGAPVTLTATVAITAPGQGIATGTVTFSNGGVALASPVTLGSSAQAKLVVPSLPPGTNSLTAAYSGDANAAASTSPVASVTVPKRTASVTIATSAAPSVAGQSVTFTATVSDSAGAVTDGSVLFSDLVGGVTTPLTTVAVDAAGHAQLTTASLTIGSHSIRARFLGGARDNASVTVSVAQVVGRAATSVTLVPSITSATLGTPVTLTASVSVNAPGTGVPGGTVTFADNGAALSTPVTLDANGQATLILANLSAGTHSFTATYSGSAAMNASASPAAPVAVALRTPIVIPAVGPSSTSVYGQTVTFTASVTDSSGAVTAGSVVWRDTFAGTTTTLGTVAVDATGTVTMPVTFTKVGNHTLSLRFLGGASDTASQPVKIAQTVTRAAAAVAITVTPLQLAPGATASVSVKTSAVTPGSGTPSGTFTVYDGATAVQSGTLAADGTATATFTPLAATGSHSITVATTGDTAFAPATSAAVVVTVGSLSGTQTLLIVSPASSTHGTAIVLSASVNLASGAVNRGARTGSVTFTIDGVAQPPVALKLNAAKLTLIGLAAGTSVGTHTVRASYSGDSHYRPSASPLKSFKVT
jgi:parallel beta-helix repeat protein